MPLNYKLNKKQRITSIVSCNIGTNWLVLTFEPEKEILYKRRRNNKRQVVPDKSKIEQK
jgi:hypothetical protein